VIFKQFVDDDLGCASYLVGDETSGRAVVVDPAYRIDPYLAEAQKRHVDIVRVLETHTHADHVSGHGRFALEHGVPVSIHASAVAEYPHAALHDGDEITLGDVVLRVIHTPGHRPEHCAFAVTDRSRAEVPWLVLTGDSLFVGDAARPDLAVEARDGATDLFGSLRRLGELGDAVEVYPGHVAGSLCGAAMSSKPSSTIGFERRSNHALTIPDLDRFVDDVAGSLPPRPPTTDHVVALNRGPFVGASAPLARLDEVPRDGVVLDVRTADAFAAGHVGGALNVPIGGSSFATKAGFVLPLEVEIVLHGSADETARAADGLRSVGFLELKGWLDDVPTLERMEPAAIDEVARLLEADQIELVDVREADERDDGYIPGSRHIPYRLARQAAQNGLAGGKPVITICESGARAAVAASVLAASGIDARPVLHGGIADWRGELIKFRRCGC
jgi:hydroxyacylglutathione hydrolase